MPRFSSVLPSKTNINLKLTKKILLKVPFLTSAMDTVTESKMAIAIAKAGGMGIIHRNLDIKDQSYEIKKVKDKKLFVGAAVGTNKEDLERVRSLLFNGVDLIVIDTAHGHSEKVLKTLSKIKKISKKYLYVLEILQPVKLQQNYTILVLILSKLVLDLVLFAPQEW